jgi:PAS domain S-box-containing protein
MQEDPLEKLFKEYPPFKTLIQALQAPFYIRSNSGEVVFCSKKLIRLFGGTSLDESCPLELSQALSYFLIRDRELLGERRNLSNESEERLIAPNGARIYIKVSRSIIMTEEKVPYLVAVVEDTTREKELQARLHGHQERLQHISAAAKEFIYEVDRELRFTHISSQAIAILCRPQEELLNKGLFDFVPGYEMERVTTWLLPYTNSRLPFHDCLIPCLSPQGQPIYIKLSGYPIIDGEGKYLGYRGMGLDVTSEVEAKNRAEQAIRLFQLAEKFAQVGGWEYKTQNKSVSWTEEALFIHGFNPRSKHPSFDELLQCYPQEDRAVLYQSIQQCEQFQIPFDIELSFTNSEGNLRHIRAIGAPIDEGHNQVRIVGAFQDTTQSKRSSRELQEAKDNLSMVIENANLGSWVWDIPNNTVEFSPLWKKMLGFEPDELRNVPETFFDRIHPDDKANVQRALDAHLKDPTTLYSVDLRMLTKSGDYRWINARGKIKDYSPGTLPQKMTGIHIDIQDLKNAEASLRDKINKIEELNCSQREQAEELKTAKLLAEQASIAKSEFLARMSHEIRTPLNAVVTVGDLLKGTALTDEQLELVDTLVGGGKQLLSLIRDILDFSKIEAGKVDTLKEPFNIIELLNSLRRTYSVVAEEKSINFLTVFDPEMPSIIYSDQGKILQILTNLVSNALKFTPPKGTVTLELGYEELENKKQCELTFSVKDNGIGIDSSQHRNIFDPFVQADQNIHKKFGGSGLGLAISSRLASILGSSLSVESSPGKGASFIFKLTTEYSRTPSGVFAKEASSSSDTRSFSILVAEDNTVNQMLIKKLLEKKGHRVTITQNGEECVATHNKEPFDVILMDILMPVMDGVLATKFIRNGSIRADIPIIALTAHALKEDVQSFFDSGISGYVAKPIEQKKLFAELVKAIDLSKRP